MSSVSDMLSVLMDGITDTGMMLDYAENAEHPGREDWFMDHARKRYQMTLDDYNYVTDSIGLKERVADEDEVAVALCNHLKKQMLNLKNRLK